MPSSLLVLVLLLVALLLPFVAPPVLALLLGRLAEVVPLSPGQLLPQFAMAAGVVADVCCSSPWSLAEVGAVELVVDAL